MKNIIHILGRRGKSNFVFLLAVFLLACSGGPPVAERSVKVDEFRSSSWERIVARARNGEVRYAMWSGDEARNRFYQTEVAAKLKEQFGITLTLVPTNDAADVINKLLNEKSAGKSAGGSIDLIWINGENFRSARQGDVLWGPFADRLPNIRYYDDEARTRDFGTPIEEYEAPYERARFVLAYDTARVPEPPRSIPALREWIQNHPGRFTYIAPPDFTGSAFIRHILLYYMRRIVIYPGPDPSTSMYQQAAAATIKYLNDIEPYLWRKGETYPVSMKEADRLFINNEIDFPMSYGPSFASERIARGEYPPTVRTFIFEEGTIGNYSFLAIPFNASNTAGALVVANELMSPAHAIAQGRAMGSLFPLRLDRLSEVERAAAQALPRGPATLSIDDLSRGQLAEPHARYLERLEKDWREKVLQQ
jgi:putative spermidine/putrescine transport system substrate-binding protein